jgi:hypothetical protein
MWAPRVILFFSPLHSLLLPQSPPTPRPASSFSLPSSPTSPSPRRRRGSGLRAARRSRGLAPPLPPKVVASSRAVRGAPPHLPLPLRCAEPTSSRRGAPGARRPRRPRQARGDPRVGRAGGQRRRRSMAAARLGAPAAMSMASRRIYGRREQGGPPPPPLVHLSTGGARAAAAGGASASLPSLPFRSELPRQRLVVGDRRRREAMQVVPYRAEYGVAAAERKRGVRPAGRRCARKNGKSDLQVALPALSRPPVQTV